MSTRQISSEKLKLLTFDLEEFFHILDFTPPSGIEKTHSSLPLVSEQILKILRDNETRAIFFCVGDTALQNQDLIREIVQEGHVVGTHSMHHKLHKELSDEEFEQDLKESLLVLEEVSGSKIEHYRAPGFSLTKDYLHRFKILKNYGIKYDFSIFVNGGSHGGIAERFLPPRDRSENYFVFEGIKSFPFTKTPIYGFSIPILGGGYFRLTPWWLLKKAILSDIKLMTYFHPRDFDFSQPRLTGLGPLRYFKAYVGIKRSYTKLQNLVSAVDWSDPRRL